MLSTVSLTHAEQRTASESLYQDFRCVLTTANIDRQILVGNPTIALLWIVVSESWNHSWPSGWHQIWMLFWKLQTSLDHSSFRSTYSHSENWMLNCQKCKTSLSQPLWFLDFMLFWNQELDAENIAYSGWFQTIKNLMLFWKLVE